jgi:hypothetical protein
MYGATDHPPIFFVFSLLVLWLSARLGATLLKGRRALGEEAHRDFDVIQASSLTLLGLIIGFSFSMAITRYDLRKSLEEAEANAISTEFMRADLLPAASAAEMRALLTRYTDQRILFYRVSDGRELQQINAATAQIQTRLWSSVTAPAVAQPTPIAALVVAGMNDVLNSQGYTQAAWWNRIPIAAWAMMILIAVCCNAMLGYGIRNAEGKGVMLLIFPLVVSVAFTLIADIDSPRGGVIRVVPQNLMSLAETLHRRG